jgi:hypothetical protein
MTLRRILGLLIPLLLMPVPVLAAPPSLETYRQALRQLNLPEARRYHQHIQFQNWQESSTDADFLFRSDGTWSANLLNDDRMSTVESHQMDIGEVDLVRLNSMGSKEPAPGPRGLLGPTIDLDTLGNDCDLTANQPEILEGVAVQHLTLVPRSGGTPRELWLDATTALPRRVKLRLGATWGYADTLLDFAPTTDKAWLLTNLQSQVHVDFWVPFKQLRFQVDVDSHWSDYQLAQAAGNVLAPQATGIDALTLDGKSKNSFQIGIATQKSNSPIADKIAQFNLSKPDVVGPIGLVDMFVNLRMGGQSQLLYLGRLNYRKLL